MKTPGIQSRWERSPEARSGRSRAVAQASCLGTLLLRQALGHESPSAGTCWQREHGTDLGLSPGVWETENKLINQAGLVSSGSRSGAPGVPTKVPRYGEAAPAIREDRHMKLHRP